MPREWMREMREAKGWDMVQAAREASLPATTISVRLLELLEQEDSYTLPVLAVVIGAAYGMTWEQIDDISRLPLFNCPGGMYPDAPVKTKDGIRLLKKEGRRLPEGQPITAKGNLMVQRSRGHEVIKLDAEKLSRMMAERGLNGYQVSRKAGKGKTWVSQMLNKARNGKPIDLQAARLAARTIGCTVTEMLGEKPER